MQLVLVNNATLLIHLAAPSRCLPKISCDDVQLCFVHAGRGRLPRGSPACSGGRHRRYVHPGPALGGSVEARPAPHLAGVGPLLRVLLGIFPGQARRLSSSLRAFRGGKSPGKIFEDVRLSGAGLCQHLGPSAGHEDVVFNAHAHTPKLGGHLSVAL